MTERVISSVHLRRNLSALFGYMVLTLLPTWLLALNLNKAIAGDSFDGWQNYRNLWWGKLVYTKACRAPERD